MVEVIDDNRVGDDYADDNGNDGDDIHVISEEDELSIDLLHEEISCINAIRDWLCNDWIGANYSLRQNEFYAKKFVEVGFDSVEIIKNNFDIDSDTKYINFMDPMHKEVFLRNMRNMRNKLW